MTTRVAAPVVRKTFAPFEKGQRWKIGDLNLVVTSVGKNLVHYRKYRMQAKGIPTTLAMKGELQKYLISSKAVFVKS